MNMTHEAINQTTAIAINTGARILSDLTMDWSMRMLPNEKS